jgi:hypothetical protein
MREAELEQKLQRADAEMARLRRMSSAQRGKGGGFDDIAHAAFNELNVPMVDRAQQQGVDQIKREVQQQIKQCVVPPRISPFGGIHSLSFPYRALLPSPAPHTPLPLAVS